MTVEQFISTIKCVTGVFVAFWCRVKGPFSQFQFLGISPIPIYGIVGDANVNCQLKLCVFVSCQLDFGPIVTELSLKWRLIINSKDFNWLESLISQLHQPILSCLRFIFRQSKIDGFLKILNFLKAIANEN